MDAGRAGGITILTIVARALAGGSQQEDRHMLSPTARLLTAAIGTALVMIFVFGLAHSISTGFAGFWGGLPFWAIAFIVMSMAAYDFWDETIRKKD
jgi:hypothetical protein